MELGFLGMVSLTVLVVSNLVKVVEVEHIRGIVVRGGFARRKPFFLLDYSFACYVLLLLHATFFYGVPIRLSSGILTLHVSQRYLQGHVGLEYSHTKS